MNIENDRYEIHMPPNSKDVGAWVAKKIKTNKAELFSAFLPVLTDHRNERS